MNVLYRLIGYILELLGWMFAALLLLPFVIGFIFPPYLFVTIGVWGSIYSVETWGVIVILLGLFAVGAGALVAVTELISLIFPGKEP